VRAALLAMFDRSVLHQGPVTRRLPRSGQGPLDRLDAGADS
jgi:hypothetical protein